MITLRELKIERPSYGKDAGKLKASIKLEGQDSTICLNLPDETGDRILALAKEAIIDAVEQAGNDLIFTLTTAIPDTLALKA